VPLAAPPSVLLVRLPNPLGDVVMATPLLRSLRCGLPNTRIVLAGKAPYGALLEGLDSFDAFLALGGKGAGSSGAGSSGASSSGAGGKSASGKSTDAQVLRQAHADAALLLPNSWSSVLAARAAGIAHRIGRRNQMRSLLLQQALPKIPAAAPMTELYADFLPSVGLPREVLAAELVVTAEPNTPLPQGAPLLGVAPGAAFGPSKSYPNALLIEALEALHEKHGLVPVWLGAPHERGLLRELSAALSFDSVVPEANGLDEAKALLSKCACILAMDNGARHMAAALQVPQVVLYGPTHPAWSAHALERTTILRREELDCLSCHHKICPKADHPCMNRIAPNDVVAAVTEAITK
jgi:heptosyltransferase II